MFRFLSDTMYDLQKAFGNDDKNFKYVIQEFLWMSATAATNLGGLEWFDFVQKLIDWLIEV